MTKWRNRHGRTQNEYEKKQTQYAQSEEQRQKEVQKEKTKKGEIGVQEEVSLWLDPRENQLYGFECNSCILFTEGADGRVRTTIRASYAWIRSQGLVLIGGL